MTYKELKERVLQLLNIYSRNGTLIDNLYNDQSDYLLRIPGFYNAAVSDIAMNGKEYIGTIDWDMVEVKPCGSGMSIMTVPDDFIKLRPVIMKGRQGTYYGGDHYTLGEDTIMIEDSLVGSILPYERVPRKLNITPGADIDDVRLDGDMEQQEAAILYVAGRLVMGEDAFAYSSFMNEYDERRSNMKRLSAEIVHTQDVYGIGGGYQV